MAFEARVSTDTTKHVQTWSFDTGQSVKTSPVPVLSAARPLAPLLSNSLPFWVTASTLLEKQQQTSLPALPSRALPELMLVLNRKHRGEIYKPQFPC